ncbi:hypothetical protein [Tumebacillus flagellatus]|uniref:Uncharacterized protein n=1 Tax=Tumebacillus flagellatus TaxID=1157490 RepID=A0A074M737_9BACL|nr:hypothetical protein [Tumebacillus flagellatus]KEO81822.1 hypothetical protein EL26_18445 [Tumebacillus flagellatus]
MIKTKCICLEGIPGSGKSTTSGLVALQAERNGANVTWFHEVARWHPVNLFRKAALSPEEFQGVCRGLSEHVRGRVEAASTRRGTYHVVDLDVLRRSGGQDARDALEPYDVWTWPNERDRAFALELWQAMVEEYRDKDEVIILDASLFQYPIYGMLWEQTPRDEIKAYVHQLLAILEPLNPVLIHLYQADSEQLIEKLLRIRGDAWVDHIVERDRERPYYKNSDVPGRERMRQFHLELRERMQEMFEETPFRKLGIENSAGEFARYDRQVLEFLELEHIPDPVLSEDALQRVAGTYTNDTVQKTIRLIPDNGTLYFEGGINRRVRLIPKDESTFTFQDSPVVLHVGEDALTLGGVELIDTWTESGLVYQKQVTHPRKKTPPHR